MNTVGGYRLVRKLGAGERAEIHLGHAGSREPPDGDRIAAIKVYRPVTDDASIDREIEALARASSRHLLELKDLATGPDGRPCLILPRLGSGTLARLLAARGTVAPGEAVSILAPLVEAVRELHRIGVAHGAVTAGSVLFDDRGAPVLARFGAVTLIADFPATDHGHSLTPAQLDEDPGAILDRIGLRQLIGTVLDHLDAEGSPEAVAALRGRIEAQPLRDAELQRLIDLLFDLAPALPIRFDDDEVLDAEVTFSGRLGPGPLNPEESAGKHPRLPLDPAAGGGRTVELHPLWAQPTEIGARDEHPLAILRSKVLAILAPVRTPVWIAGGAGLGALVIALTVIPAAHSETVPGAAPTGSSASASPSVVATASPGAAAPSALGPAATSAIEGEDPLAAARALLAARTRCFVGKSPTCFDAVDQAGSAVIEADRELFRRVKKGVPLPAEATLEGFTPRLIQQLGDSVIIQLVDAEGSTVTTKNPAPLLLVRSEAGWRIRDLVLG
jgi:hypothetical protein